MLMAVVWCREFLSIVMKLWLVRWWKSWVRLRRHLCRISMEIMWFSIFWSVAIRKIALIFCDRSEANCYICPVTSLPVMLSRSVSFMQVRLSVLSWLMSYWLFPLVKWAVLHSNHLHRSKMWRICLWCRWCAINLPTMWCRDYLRCVQSHNLKKFWL